MYEQFFEELRPVVIASATRTQSLVDAVTATFDIDWNTGQVVGADVAAVARAMRSVANGPLHADDLARSFVATISDGFAVGRNDIGPQDPRFRPIPWRSLFHEPSLSAMTVNDWDWLGIQQDSGAEAIATSLRRFRTVPAYMQERAYLDSIASSAAFYLPLLRTAVAMPRPSGFAPRRDLLRPDLGPGVIRESGTGVLRQELGGEEAPKPPAPAPAPGPDYAQIAATVLGFIKQIGECFARAQWSIQWAAFYPLGVRICLDAACTQKVADAFKGLLGTSAGSLISAIGVLVAKGLLTWGALLSAAGWVGLAMLHFASYWTAMILANMTPRGVCIVHLFPWNAAVSGGLFNGWAEGR